MKSVHFLCLGIQWQAGDAHFLRSKSWHWKWWYVIDTTIPHSFNVMCWKPCMKDHHWSDRWVFVLLWPCWCRMKIHVSSNGQSNSSTGYNRFIWALQQCGSLVQSSYGNELKFLWTIREKNSEWQRAWNYLRTGPIVPRVETLSSLTCGGLWHVEKHRSHRLPCFDHMIHLSESESRLGSEGASMFNLETSLIKSNKH